MPPQTCIFGLLRRRQLCVPTRRGWALMLLLAGALVLCGVRFIHPFLAVDEPVRGGFLVVEGWVPDAVLEEALKEYETHSYTGFFVTGGPLEKGMPFSEFGTYAELSASCLRVMSEGRVEAQPVSASGVVQNRTYSSAFALRTWGREHGRVASKINVVSVGAHSRRTRLLYQKAFGGAAEIGIISGKERGFDPARWWGSSAGVRAVVDEVVAYLYARCLFWPSVEGSREW